MDWIKVKTKHILYEYTDLSDSEFRAWIVLMALTANLEHEPTHKQMLKEIHHKTLHSLQEKVKKHSTTLQDIFKKVSSDVQEVLKKRESWKEKKKKKREDSKNVPGDVPIDVSPKRREEKRREEKNKEKKVTDAPFALPEWIPKDLWDAYLEVRKNKRAAKTTRALNLVIAELGKIKTIHNQDPIEVLKKSIRSGWSDVYPLKDDGGGNGNRNHTGRGSGASEISTPKEWKGDDLPKITDEERKRNLDKIKTIFPDFSNQ